MISSTADLLRSINERLHPGTSCPGAGALGECAALDTTVNGFMVAELYLWAAGDTIQAAEVATWFKEAGCQDVVVSHVLEDDDNDTHGGRTFDGARHWQVEFHPGV